MQFDLDVLEVGLAVGIGIKTCVDHVAREASSSDDFTQLDPWVCGQFQILIST
jgi:hypothetical protein